ncbi:family 54 glycoside hydrolase [Xylariaceae sp. FL1019]|nr:family 54 glycoside hydrolase [Xylariaceae sp. FL1019]
MLSRPDLLVGFTAAASLVAAGPCDIYASGGTPCIAAHSSTRALYDGYKGALYQVKRGSDNATMDVAPLSAGGAANAATQDNFCNGSTCLISKLYDQSGMGNHLTQAPAGGAARGPNIDGTDFLSGARGAPVTVKGKSTYGVFISPFTGYRNNDASGTAVNDEPQGMYAVFDGTHYNNKCCFDYGNAETSNLDTGNGQMEAIYFGAGDGWSGSGAGSGPWIMADLENGLFSGYDPHLNSADQTVNSRFVTAIVKGEPGTWAIRGGDSTNGGLSTFYDGDRPAGGYDPMQKWGAIILGIGGDNSNGAQGTFYEGVMTQGYPSDDTENKVQADIIAAGYATRSMNDGPSITVGSTISLKVTTPGYTDRVLAHSGDVVNTQAISTSDNTARWTVRSGLANSGCYSFESVDTPGSYIRHSAYQLRLNSNDGSKVFSEDATFCTQSGISGSGISIRSWSYAARYWRHYDSLLYIAGNSGPMAFDSTVSYNADVTFAIA